MLLGTTLVHVSSTNGNSLVVRAVIDSGSMITCLSENSARILSLKRWSDEHCKVDGLSYCQIRTRGLSKIKISALNGTEVAQDHPVVILDKITSDLPHVEVPLEVKEKFKNLVLADPTFYLPSCVDMLIGADLFPKIVTGDRLILGDNIPAAINSVFGYLIIGSAPIEKRPNAECDSTKTLLTTYDVDLHRLLQRFWILEEPPLQLKPSPEEETCELHYATHHSRDSTGRYTVRLPFKPNHAPLGISEATAKRRFLSLEKRLNSNPELKKEYIQCMKDYMNSGHMELVTAQIPEESKHFFLPHHAVMKSESSSTKMRVVFDASAKSSTGVSLNQTLLSGQKLHNEICDILIQFRCYPIVFSCDIRQMFRQIRMHPDDRNFQLFFWRENPTQPLSIYCLTTVVFGFVCSPYLAIRTLRQLIADEGDKYPLAARVLKKQVYVDDLILGAHSLEEALLLQKETIQLLSKGGFDLRKWISNCPELVSNMPRSHLEKPLHFQSSDNPFYSVLGIKWVSETDQFAYRLQIPDKPLTKRNILSAIAQIFDPCGFLAPVIFWAKALLQLLWTLGLQWDELVPGDITEKWEKFCSQIPELNKIHIFCYLSLYDAVDVQLHGFSDGSEAGYGAAVYVRMLSADGNVSVSLLIAKSRVAPLKRISVPRLELCGAHLLTELLNYSVNLISQQCRISSTKAWCDSSVVLSWIHTPPYRLKVYIANRVAQIQDLTPAHMWSHISTNCNPADCASRSLLPSTLVTHDMWWYGPPWLRHTQEMWPTSRFTLIQEEELPESKSEPLRILVTVEESAFITKFSSWSKLLRVIAYVLRFFRNVKNHDKETGSLKLNELSDACLRICRLTQKSEFQEDLARLQAGKPATARLQPLSPFVDEEGLLHHKEDAFSTPTWRTQQNTRLSCLSHTMSLT